MSKGTPTLRKEPLPDAKRHIPLDDKSATRRLDLIQRDVTFRVGSRPRVIAMG